MKMKAISLDQCHLPSLLGRNHQKKNLLTSLLGDHLAKDDPHLYHHEAVLRRGLHTRNGNIGPTAIHRLASVLDAVPEEKGVSLVAAAVAAGHWSAATGSASGSGRGSARGNVAAARESAGKGHVNVVVPWKDAGDRVLVHVGAQLERGLVIVGDPDLEGGLRLVHGVVLAVALVIDARGTGDPETGVREIGPGIGDPRTAPRTGGRETGSREIADPAT